VRRDDLRDLRSDFTIVGGRVTHARGFFEALREQLTADNGYHGAASG
jgi:hypothetical protein